MENTKKLELSRIDIVEETRFKKIVKRLRRLEKEEFGKFSALVTVMFTAGIWLVKSLWYAYLSGEFSVYNIDRKYINVDSENVILDIIQMGAILIIWFYINYVYYKISVGEDKSWFKWRSRGKKTLFWLGEMVGISILLLGSSRTNLWELYREAGWVGIVFILLLMWVTCVMINLFAIEYLIEIRRIKKRKLKEEEKRKKEDQNKRMIRNNKMKERSDEKKTKNKEKKQEEQVNKRNRKTPKREVIELIFMFLVTISFEMVMFYFLGTRMAYSRNEYKVVFSEVDESTISKYDIYFGENGRRYEVFPIVFENEDCYILTKLYIVNEEIRIDYDFQQIIDNEGIETRYVENIYAIE